MAWDVTCMHRITQGWRSMSTAVGTPAADSAEDRKMAKYSFLESTYVVQPVAVQTLGGLGKQTRVFLRTLGRAIAFATQEPKAEAYLQQRISVAVQIGNTAAILETFTD